MVETWRAVVGYETCYEVSNHGRVRRIASHVHSVRATSGLRSVPPRILSPSIVRGYPTINLSQLGAVKKVRIHTLVAGAFIGPRPLSHDVNHKDGNKRNNRESNLEYVTEAANNQHAYDVCGKRSRLAVGERHPQAKLTAAQVVRIRAMRKTGLSLGRIGREFGVYAQTIAQIVNGKTWRSTH